MFCIMVSCSCCLDAPAKFSNKRNKVATPDAFNWKNRKNPSMSSIVHFVALKPLNPWTAEGWQSSWLLHPHPTSSANPLRYVRILILIHRMVDYVWNLWAWTHLQMVITPQAFWVSSCQARVLSADWDSASISVSVMATSLRSNQWSCSELTRGATIAADMAGMELRMNPNNLSRDELLESIKDFHSISNVIVCTGTSQSMCSHELCWITDYPFSSYRFNVHSVHTLKEAKALLNNQQVGLDNS